MNVAQTSNYRDWQDCLNALEAKLPVEAMNTWLKSLQVDTEAQQVVLYAPNKHIRDGVTDHYLEQIEAFYTKQRTTSPPSVIIKVGSAQKPSDPLAVAAKPLPEDGSGAACSPAKSKASPANHTKATGSDSNRFESRSPLNQSLDFSRFVVGTCNQVASSASHGVVRNPGCCHNPLFLYGGVGLGKTHLMQAIGNALRAQSIDSRVVYIHAEQFVADMVSANQSRCYPEFRHHYRSADALLIDDIRFFEGKKQSQQELLQTFNGLIENHRQLIVTSDQCAGALKGLDERLKSRLGSGMSAKLEAPCEATRTAILRLKAEEQGLTLSPETASCIAQIVTTNVRDLEGVLKTLMVSVRSTGQEMTPAVVREYLKELLAMQESKCSLENIMALVADYYQISVADLVSCRRSHSIARPRQLAMALARSYTQYSLPEIGRAFGNRDHSTVVYACQKVNERRQLDTKLQADYEQLATALK